MYVHVHRRGRPNSKPSRASGLLSLVRQLIDYGRQLAVAFRNTPGLPPPPARPLFPGWTPACLPTPEQIAAEVRRRPIGAVIADICRDLGIMPNHPLWRELRDAIIRYGGSLARLVKDICDCAFQTSRLALAAQLTSRRSCDPRHLPAPARPDSRRLNRRGVTHGAGHGQPRCSHSSAGGDYSSSR